MPQPVPGLDCGPGFSGVRLPPPTLAREGLGGSEQGPFLGRTPSARSRRFGGQGIELACNEHTGHNLDCGRQPTQVFLGRIAAIAEHANLAGRQFGGHKVDDLAGQGTARAIRKLELASLRLFEIERQTDGNTETVVGPQRQGDSHDPPHKV